MADSRKSKGSVVRWLVLVVMLGAAGWASFTLYERSVAASGPARATNPRLEGFVARGYELLVAGDLDGASEQFHKASGIDEKDARAIEGLALVEVMRAEWMWLELTTSRSDQAERTALVDKLDTTVDRAREQIAGSRRATDDDNLRARLRILEHRLNTILVLSLKHAGQAERARGAVSARLGDHPQQALLRAFVGHDIAAAPATSAQQETDAGVAATAEPSAKPSEPASTLSPAAAAAMPHEKHYEFDHEPKLGEQPTVPGELQLPGGTKTEKTGD